jgi:hypothetical protein
MILIMRNEPNFQKSQMFITATVTMNCSEKMKLDTWSKRTQTNPIQSQSNPIYIVFIRFSSWLNSKQSQNKPNQTQPVVSKVEPFMVNLPRQSRRERFVLTFPENFFKFVDIGSVAQAVEQRTFNA